MKQEFAKNAIRAAYDDSETVTRYIGGSYLWRSEEILIQRFFPNTGEVLDLGCGTGRTSIPLSQMSLHVVGMDISFLMVKEAKLEAVEKGVSVDYLQMDASTLAFEDNSFDGALFSFNEMDHMVGYKGKLQVLSQIFRVLKPGAPFIFSVHRIWSQPHLRALIRGGLKLYLGKILGVTTLEKEWGEIYDLKAENPEERYSHFMASRKWESGLREVGFNIICRQSRSQLESNGLRQRIRSSVSSYNYMFFVACKPGL
jgi:ubiquinone/menaquinone biosynthesis C-methylase UbiE